MVSSDSQNMDNGQKYMIGVNTFNELKTFLVFVLLACLSNYAMSESVLNATVDRTKIYQNDTLNLTIVGDVQLEFSFGGLLNFGRNSLDAPTIEGLEDDFQIIDQQQKYNMQSINGQNSAQITWTYTLLPKKTGNLTIPAASYKDAKASSPISIEVLAGKPPRNAEKPPEVFIEIEVDKNEAYVQEQVVFTQRLYAADHLASGEWSSPEPENAIVEQSGETNKYFAMAFNQRYEVRERQFLIFPQKSGSLDIAPMQFSGIMIDSRNRQRKRVFETSDPVSVAIKPPPANFSGDLWLPAMSLTLNERWDVQDNEMEVGQASTRIFDLQALGLLGSALPPLEMLESPGLKVYPDQPTLNSVEHESGVQSQRIETNAVVAVSPSSIDLPEIRLPWWDTVNDVERVAIIPARTITISQAANASAPTAPLENVQLDTTQTEDTSSDANATTNEGLTDVASDYLNTLYALIIFLILGWVITTILLLRRGNSPKTKADEETESVTAAVSRNDLKQALTARNPDFPRLVIVWLRQIRPDLNINSYQDLKLENPELVKQLEMFESAVYGTRTTGVLDESGLLAMIDKFQSKKVRTNKNKQLQPFYP